MDQLEAHDGFAIEPSLTLNDESNGAKKKASASNQTSCPLMIGYHGQNESNNISHCIGWDSKKLSLEVLIPKASDDCRSKER